MGLFIHGLRTVARHQWYRADELALDHKPAQVSLLKTRLEIDDRGELIHIAGLSRDSLVGQRIWLSFDVQGLDAIVVGRAGRLRVRWAR